MKKQAKLKSKGQIRSTVVRKDSPFEKYMGIGNPGIGTARKSIKKWLRGLRSALDAE